jgi:hypothetical protein
VKKTQRSEKLALFVGRSDAETFLEPLVDASLANGLTAAQVLAGVSASAERILRASLSDSGLPVHVRRGVILKTSSVKAEARNVAKKSFRSVAPAWSGFLCLASIHASSALIY